MKNLKTLVVEDEGLARRRIERMVKKHEKLTLIENSAENGASAIKKIVQYKPDLILLDIELKDFTAFEVLKTIGPIRCKVVFITAFSEYAVKAFDVEAIDYLLKPFSEERFNMAIEKVMDRKSNFDFEEIKKILNKKESTQGQKIIVPEGNTQHFINGNEIEYIFSQTYYANFMMNNQKKLIRISLKNLEEILPDNFFRINKSTIVNRNHLKELVKNKSTIKIIMKDQNEFFVSDYYKAKINSW